MAPAVPPGSPEPEPSPLLKPHAAQVPRTRNPLRGADLARPRHRPIAPRKTKRAELAVVVVNFCQWRNTARLVAQLRRSVAVRSGDAEIVVVDNHSPFHPVVRKLCRLGGVTVRRFSRNHGFARAVNRGSLASRGRAWVLLLNPDVTVPDGFLDEALAVARSLPESDPSAGAVGFRLRNRDGSDQASAGPFPTLWNSLAGLVLPRSRRKCRHISDHVRQEVDWVTGGCLLVRRDCFEQLGGLDETFFLYYEDVDFCRRAADAGWSVWYDPALEVMHHWPLHARRVPAALRLMTRHALLTYSHKHWSRWESGLLAGLLWVEASLRQAWAAVRGDGDSARCHGQLRKLIGDVCRGRDADARRRIRRAAAFLDPVAAEQDGRTG